MTYAWDRTVITRPEDERRALEAAEQIRPGVRIKASQHVPEGTMFIINDEAIDLLLDPAPLFVSREQPPVDFLGWRYFNPDWAMKITGITAS